MSVSDDGTVLTCTTSANDVGEYDVVVTKPDGSATAPQQYLYSEAPFFTSISPEDGSIAGGNSVTIEGANFANAEVTIGGGVCEPVVAADDQRSLTCTVPAGSEGLPTL